VIELIAGLATFVRVAARAFQQRSVVGDHFYAVIPVSYIMGALEIYIVTIIVVEGFSLLLVLAIGTGGWIGSILAMKLHNKCFGKEKKKYARHAKEYLEAIKTSSESHTRSDLEGIERFYRTDLNSIHRALDALWNQENGRN